MLTRSIISVFVVASLAGCGLLPAENSSTVTGQVNALESELESVKAELEKLQGQVFVDRYLVNADRTAYLKPGDAGYSLIRYDLGVLTVALDNVEPYANGSKITLRFGNPLASSIDGLKAKIEWANVNAEGAMDEKTLRSKEVTFNESLLPGAWTTASVVLESMPPSSLGIVRISEASHTGIHLSRR